MKNKWKIKYLQIGKTYPYYEFQKAVFQNLHSHTKSNDINLRGFVFLKTFYNGF